MQRTRRTAQLMADVVRRSVSYAVPRESWSRCVDLFGRYESTSDEGAPRRLPDSVTAEAFAREEERWQRALTYSLVGRETEAFA